MNKSFSILIFVVLFTLSHKVKAQEGIPKTPWPVLKCTDSTLFVTKVTGQNEAKSFVINVVKDTVFTLYNTPDLSQILYLSYIDSTKATIVTTSQGGATAYMLIKEKVWRCINSKQLYMRAASYNNIQSVDILAHGIIKITFMGNPIINKAVKVTPVLVDLRQDLYSNFSMPPDNSTSKVGALTEVDIKNLPNIDNLVGRIILPKVPVTSK